MSEIFCSVDGCGGKHWANGYCSLHYKRVRKNGSPGPVGRVRFSGRICKIEGCGRRHCGLGLCAMHYQRLRHQRHAAPMGDCRCVNGHEFSAPCIEEPDVNATIVEQNCSVCDADDFEILDVSYPEDDDDPIRHIISD